MINHVKPILVRWYLFGKVGAIVTYIVLKVIFQFFFIEFPKFVVFDLPKKVWSLSGRFWKGLSYGYSNIGAILYSHEAILDFIFYWPFVLFLLWFGLLSAIFSQGAFWPGRMVFLGPLCMTWWPLNLIMGPSYILFWDPLYILSNPNYIPYIMTQDTLVLLLS